MYRRYGGNTPRTSTGRPRTASDTVGCYPYYSSARIRARAFDRDRIFWGPSDVNLYCDSDEEEEECTSEVAIPILETKLHVISVDLHIPENTRTHHTDRYTCTSDRVRASDGKDMKAQLVIRRGQPFKMTINFDRPYDIEKNDITMEFNLGESYRPNKKLSCSFKVDESGNTDFNIKKWGATVIDQTDNSVTLSVFVPATAPVGEWGFGVRTIVDVIDGDSLIWQYNHNDEFSILFNPWCKDDWVYLEHQDWLNEAVLNDSGVMYYGDPARMGARTWYQGQFDEGMLEASLHLIRKGFGYEATPIMGDPTKVSRMLTKMVNAPDDDGVVMGNWTGDYEDGTSPTKWIGSVKILEEYMETGKPVKYGQCWVFAGVLNTVCRAVGLPCRTITTFASAHNTDADHLSIDIINVKGDDGEWHDISSDSIWNFHCWNEVWMRRPDLSDTNEYDGWQVIDSTPQEKSYDGVYTVGPCPVASIKEGDITVGSDGAFIFCEVNGDEVEWKECEKSGMLLETKRSTDVTGLSISTHLPTGRAYRGDSIRGFFSSRENLERLDLTDTYKYREGSAKEREVVRKAERIFHRAAAYRNGYLDDHNVVTEKDISVEIEQGEDIFVGEGFEFLVKVKNSSQIGRVVNTLVIKVLYKTYYDAYTGIAGVKKFDSFRIEANEEICYRIAVDEERATRRPQDGYNFEIKALVDFPDKPSLATGKMNFRLRRPDVRIEGPRSCSVKDKINLDVSFTNPLKVTLTNCLMDIEGGFTCIKPSSEKFLIPNIGPGMTWRETLTVQPKRNPKDKDERDMTIGFHCKQLSDVYGHYAVDITSLW